jgi:hypothetical protein
MEEAFDRHKLTFLLPEHAGRERQIMDSDLLTVGHPLLLMNTIHMVL